MSPDGWLLPKWAAGPSPSCCTCGSWVHPGSTSLRLASERRQDCPLVSIGVTEESFDPERFAHRRPQPRDPVLPQPRGELIHVDGREMGNHTNPLGFALLLEGPGTSAQRNTAVACA